MAIMTNTELAEKLKAVATSYKTLYVRGCIGAPMTTANKRRYTQNCEYNRRPKRTAMINAASSDTFGFDCSCLIKGILWGWKGDKTATYGGATYASNGVPDIGANQLITVCKNVSSDFTKIEVGEAVWMKGHIGIYIGDGFAVECTPSWDNKVQITACNCSKDGYNRRNWKKHGKLPYVKYADIPLPKPTEPFKKGDLVRITGTKYYNGTSIPAWVKAKNWYVKQANGARVVIDRSEDGNHAICSPVNAANLQLVNSKPQKSVDELAHEVIQGLWGCGEKRKQRLTEAGYDYGAVQARVNELLK